MRRDGGDFTKVVCPTELRKGKCDRSHYMHVKDAPKSLASIEGLVASDLAGVSLSFDAKEGVFICGESAKPLPNGQSEASFANMISQECKHVAEELLEEFVVVGASGSEGVAGDTGQSVFHRHSQ